MLIPVYEAYSDDSTSVIAFFLYVYRFSLQRKVLKDSRESRVIIDNKRLMENTFLAIIFMKLNSPERH